MLLLYSGGLDTSVMRKWIQTSTRPRSSPSPEPRPAGEDFESLKGKALQLCALDCVVVTPERVRRELRAAAIKANALYGGYPVFTALGRR